MGLPLPPELQPRPPRDPSAAAALLAKNKKLVRGLFIGGALLLPLVLFIGWWKFGEIDAFIIGGAFGISALVELFAVAMMVQSRRALRLFCEGVATVGRVTRVQAPADRRGNAYVFLDVEFKNARGETLQGKVATLGNVKDVDAKEGGEVVVLHLPDTGQFGVYTPGLGISVGRTGFGSSTRCA